jgi:hypothetical protein
MDMRTFLAAAVLALVAGSALAQTQPTDPSAYPTSPTISSAYPTSAINPCYSTDRTSRRDVAFVVEGFGERGLSRRSRRGAEAPCYSVNPSYSVTILLGSFHQTTSAPGASSLNEDEAKSQIEAKGYSDVSGLQKDNHGIWRGKAIMKDGRPVTVILDLQGNIYSEIRRVTGLPRPVH